MQCYLVGGSNTGCCKNNDYQACFNSCYTVFKWLPFFVNWIVVLPFVLKNFQRSGNRQMFSTEESFKTTIYANINPSHVDRTNSVFFFFLYDVSLNAVCRLNASCSLVKTHAKYFSEVFQCNHRCADTHQHKGTQLNIPDLATELSNSQTVRDYYATTYTVCDQYATTYKLNLPTCFCFHQLKCEVDITGTVTWKKFGRSLQQHSGLYFQVAPHVEIQTQAKKEWQLIQRRIKEIHPRQLQLWAPQK